MKTRTIGIHWLKVPCGNSIGAFYETTSANSTGLIEIYYYYLLLRVSQVNLVILHSKASQSPDEYRNSKEKHRTMCVACKLCHNFLAPLLLSASTLPAPHSTVNKFSFENDTQEICVKYKLVFSSAFTWIAFDRFDESVVWNFGTAAETRLLCRATRDLVKNASSQSTQNDNQ